MSRLTERFGQNATTKEPCYIPAGIGKKEGNPLNEIVNKLGRLEDLADEGRLIEVIRCRNCIRHENSSSTEGFGWCDEYECITADDGYCSRAVDKLAELK